MTDQRTAPEWWVGTDEHGGIANPGRPDTKPPAHWRLEAVAATERPRQLELSPDGMTLAFMLDRDTSDVWTLPVADGHPTRVTTGRPLAAFWDDGNAVWSPDGTRLAYCQGGKVMVVAAAGGVPTETCAASGPVWLDDQRLIVGIDHGMVTALAVVDIARPWPRPLADAGADYVTAVVSPDRSQVAYTVFHHDDLNCTSLHVAEVATGASRVVAHHAGFQLRSPVWSPDGATLAYAGEWPGWYEVFTVEAAPGGTPPRQLTTAGADFAELAFSADGASLVATRSRHGLTDLVRIDTADGSVVVLAAGGTWSAPCPLPDGSVAAVHESFTTPARVCVVTPTGELRELFAPTPAAVRAAPHVVPQHVAYRSFDGKEVYGWLYRPEGASAERPCPVVVQPHGGPTSLTGDEWDGVAQYFVDKGYAWFALNFRGSTSYGLQFERANHGVWGVADTHDCLAAHDHLATLDWVDPARVAIFGASYGSYLALHSVVDDPEPRFACAVAKYGDCDILTSWAQGDLVGRLDLERMMGHPRGSRAEYTAGSPIHRIEHLQVPILIA
ncbi:MAG: prolyl oligopeptidase family serine peptidase, partial [Actinomycetota bacterium]|nr:prolyl oligopeptidase family serine peptidase [Actinomycetota bacterium]